MSPICILRTMWWSLKTGKPVSGHSYVEIDADGKPKCVQLLKCEACNKHSIAWSACARCSPSARGGI